MSIDPLSTPRWYTPVDQTFAGAFPLPFGRRRVGVVPSAGEFVYRLIHHDTVVYVGTTTSLSQRLAEHARPRSVLHLRGIEFDRWEAETVRSRWLREAALIAALQPIGNRR